jgi:4-aminobutyrate aminotransferase-like enzyme
MMATTAKGGMWSYFYPVPPHDIAIVRFPYAYCYRCPYEREYPSCDLFCVKWIEKNLLQGKESPLVDQRAGVSNVAALIVEPMQSSAGYIIPPDDYLRELKSLCERYGIVFVADEIQTGMGKTGKMWAVQHSGVEPDIMCIGKGIAGGLPMSLIVARSEILDSWAPGAHVSTFAGYSLGCAVALEVLKIMEEEGLVERSREMGQYFLDGLLDLQRRHPILGHVNGKGLYIGLELVRNRKTKEPAIEETNYVFNRAIEEGLLFEKGGYLYNRFQLIPSLVITKEDIDYVLTTFDKLFGEAEKKFGIG